MGMDSRWSPVGTTRSELASEGGGARSTLGARA